MIPANLGLALHSRAEVLYHARKVTLTRYPFADLVLPTGEIVTCDALVGQEVPFVRTVAPGTYPVFLTVTDIAARGERADHRVIFASVVLRAGEPVRWRIAKQRAVTQYGHQGAYFVDTGTGCFMDRTVADVLRPHLHADRDYYMQVVELLDQTHSVDALFPVEHLIHCLNYTPESPAGGNCIMFGTGLGDGEYASYWGEDAAGEPLCLVTDFWFYGPEKLRVLHAEP
jgi:hypothetical protein